MTSDSTAITHLSADRSFPATEFPEASPMAPADQPAAGDNKAMPAQYGPHRFGEGSYDEGGTDAYRGQRFDVADLTGARFTDCDMSRVKIVDSWLVGVDISGYVSGLVVNGVDVTGYVDAELDRRFPERVQLREMRTADDFRAMWDTIERLWSATVARALELPEAALHQRVDEEWSFAETLRHLIFITDAWASRTILDEPGPYHPIGVTQTAYPAAEAAVLGIDAGASPALGEVLAVRADRMAVIRGILDGLTDADLGRLCTRSPAPGYPEEERPVGECLSVVMDEECEHHRFASRDLAVLTETS
jgi:DinB superfamily